MPIVYSAIGLIILIAFAGLMTSSEAAMSVLSADDIRAEASKRRARRSLMAIADDVGHHRTVATFMRIVAESSAAVWVTAAMLSTSLPLWASLLITITVLTASSFVLAGSSPRSVGRAHPQAVLGFSAVFIHLSRVILGPLATALVSLGDKVTPGRPGTTTFASEEQLLSMVDEAVQHEVLENDDRELIRSIFEWGETLTREVMVPRIDMTTIAAHASVSDAAKVFLDSGYSRIPVTGEDTDDIIGIVTLRDVVRKMVEQPTKTPLLHVKDFARSALFVPESKKADETLRLMQEESNHMAMVVDEHGGIAGLLTLEDLIEELVGDIADEHDRGGPDVEKLGEYKYKVVSRYPVDELGELFGLELEDEDVDSVGGLLAKELGSLPKVGDSVNVSGLIITADRSGFSRQRVTRVVVERDHTLIEVQDAFGESEN